MAEFDDQTETLVQQLYQAWSTNADPSSYLYLRDQLLSQRERVDTCITTLKTVVTVTCPQISEGERYFDPKWEELFVLAEAIEPSAEGDDVGLGKRKRTYNEVQSLRNLAVVSALWSPGVVRHYGWNSAAQGCLRLLKTCALRFPNFGKQFCPRLNRILLTRHCEAIVSGRLKTLSEAPLQCYRDLNLVLGGDVVPDPETEELWVTSSDGVVPVDSNGRVLKDVRPYHVQQHLLRHDHYGMLVARADWDHAPVNIDQQSDFWLAPSAHENYLADDNRLGLTFASTDMITQSEADYLLNSLAFPCEDEAVPYSANGASALTLPSNNAVGLASNSSQVHNLYDASSSDMSEQSRPQNDDASNMSTETRENRQRMSQEDSVASLSRATTTARLPASLADSCAQASAITSQPKRKPTMEDELRKNHGQRLSKYIERLREEAKPGHDQRVVRSQWLTSNIKWARIWSMAGSKDLLPGTATSKANCDVLYCSADRILEAARSGEVFQKPVIIKEPFSDAGMHNYERILSLLEDAESSDEQVEVRCIDKEQPMHRALSEFTAYLRMHPERTDGCWMSTARSVAKCHRPLFTLLNRFRLLESLSEGLHDEHPKSAHSPLLKAASGSFNTISFPGAFSGPYLNTPAGSWQRNLSGVKLWVFVPATGISHDDLASLANEQNHWLPRGKQHLVVLEENDVLFVPPGLRLVQAWHTPTTCLTEQGMLWDDLSILSILESMTLGCEHPAVQNDCAAQQFFRMMTNLDYLVSKQTDRFRGSMAQEEFIARFREACRSWLAICSNRSGD